jgi:hypothetical protein
MPPALVNCTITARPASANGQDRITATDGAQHANRVSAGKEKGSVLGCVPCPIAADLSEAQDN